MVADWRRKQKRNREYQAANDTPIEIESVDDNPDDSDFVSSWRDELLTQVWIDLEDFEEDSGRPWNTVLRAKISNTGTSTGQLAEIVTQKTDVTRELPRRPASSARQVRRFSGATGRQHPGPADS